MGIPDCALTCLAEVVSKSTCALTDFACICADPKINAQLQPCVLGSCTVKEALTAKNATYTTCGYPTSDDTGVFPVTNIVGIVVAIVAVVVRLANRAMDRRLGLDDYLIVVSLLFAAAVSGIGLALRDYGLGKDMWTLPFDDIRQTLKLFFTEEILYCICIALVKCSILTLYFRLFPGRGMRISVFIALGITAAWAFIGFFVLLFSCSPISYYWNKWDGEHEGKCISHNNILLAHSTINIVLDVGIMAIPMPTLFRLQMPLEKRLGVSVMFAVGIVVTIISIFRLVETVGFNSTTNPTKDFVPVGIWSLLEFDVAIVCACLPAVRSLAIHFYSITVKKATQVTNLARMKVTGASGSGTGTGSRSRDQYSQHLSSKSAPIDANTTGGGQFIRLKEIETRDERWAPGDVHGDSLGNLPSPTSPTSKRESLKKHNIFSRKETRTSSSPPSTSAHSFLRDSDSS
ncbi:CFEM domain-containing protein [Aspergillus aurantiobrunneus]